MSKPTWTGEDLRDELDRYERELREAGKTRNTVTSYVQPVERFLNWLIGSRPTGAVTTPLWQLPPNQATQAGSKGRRSRYDGLRDYLSRRTQRVVHLSFVEIEQIIGGSLPASAKQYPAWWSNHEPGTNVQARSWLDVGRRTASVDLKGATVDFVR